MEVSKDRQRLIESADSSRSVANAMSLAVSILNDSAKGTMVAKNVEDAVKKLNSQYQSLCLAVDKVQEEIHYLR